jgi:hypothetical protein
LLQETTSKNPETTLYEIDSTDNLLSGRELFQEAYLDIYNARKSNTSNLSSEILKRFKDEHRQVLDTLDPDIETDFPIPKYGISAEVLFYLAVCSKGYKDQIKPSSLYEDSMNQYDFHFFNTQLDTTCAFDNDTFRQKWSEGHHPTLFIPIVPLKKMFKEEEKKRINFPYQDTYQYKLIAHQQQFNVDKFLKDTININVSITDIIIDFYKNHNSSSSYRIKNNVFGHITPQLIRQQKSLLDLIKEKLITTP